MMKIKIFCLFLSVLMSFTLPVSASEWEETELLACAVEAAAPGAGYTVQVSVAAVLVNRLKDKGFPSSLAAVIADAGIDVSSAIPSGQALRAAADALGGFDPTSGALHYSSGGMEDIPLLLGTDGWSFY